MWDLLPFFEISMCENATSQSGSLSTVRQLSTNSGNQHKMEWYSLWLQKGVKFPSGYEFQSLNLRLVYDYVCHSVGKVSCTPYTEIWVLTPFWERFSWSVNHNHVLHRPDSEVGFLKNPSFFTSPVIESVCFEVWLSAAMDFQRSIVFRRKFDVSTA